MTSISLPSGKISEAMVEALRKLANEVGGLIAFEPEVRQAIGNTNWSVLQQRLAEADMLLSTAALSVPAPGTPLPKDTSRFKALSSVDDDVPTPPAGDMGAVKVKPLAWRKGYSDEHVTIEQASFGGLYQVRILDGMVWVDWPARAATQFPSVETAKAAIQDEHARSILSALSSTPVGEMDGRAREKLKLWFFRDMNDEQRLKLFSLFDLPTDEIGKAHGRQSIALKHVLSAFASEGGERS